MATFTEAGETWNTTAGNKTVTATPASSDLIVIVAGASTMTGADDITVSDDNSDGLGTYVRSARALGGGTTAMLDIWIRTGLIGSATSTIFTMAPSGDTGGGLTVMRLSGMTWVGRGVVRQAKSEDNNTEDPPSIAFAEVTLTGNPILIAVMCEDNPAALTVPTSFNETTDTGWASPTTGIHVCFVNSGQTLSTYAYAAGGAATDHCEVAVELDASAFSATTHGPAARLQLIRNSGMCGLRRK